jgi:hypothetical protein
MRTLQALVIFMAVLIFIAMGFLVYGLLTRVGGTAEDAVPAAVASSLAPFDDVDVALPSGGSVAWLTVTEGRIVVHVGVENGPDEIRVFDLATGVPLGTIRLVPAR